MFNKSKVRHRCRNLDISINGPALGDICLAHVTRPVIRLWAGVVESRGAYVNEKVKAISPVAEKNLGVVAQEEFLASSDCQRVHPSQSVPARFEIVPPLSDTGKRCATHSLGVEIPTVL